MYNYKSTKASLSASMVHLPTISPLKRKLLKNFKKNKPGFSRFPQAGLSANVQSASRNPTFVFWVDIVPKM